MPGPGSSKKRRAEEALRKNSGRPKKKVRKQRAYHSSSEDEGSDNENGTDFKPVSLEDSDDERVQEDDGVNQEERVSKLQEQFEERVKLRKGEGKKEKRRRDEDSEDEEELGDSEDDEDDEFDLSDASSTNASTTRNRKVSKRNDPTAFSTSISKILSTKLSTSARVDPVLSRSQPAALASSNLANERLERRARAKLRAEKKEELDRGRVTDVLGIEAGEAGGVQEEEKRLRKVAQRGVVRLFNAVRAAQVKAEEAMKAEKQKGTVGMGERSKVVNEVSQKGFLDLIGGGKKGKKIEEA